MPGEFHHEHGGLGAHDHVVFQLSNGATVTYNDARRFGFMDLVPRSGIETCRHFAGMGIEPLGNELSGETIARLFAGKRTPLKAALLDQRLIAGLGNIYVCEALFRTGLHPEAPAGSLATKTGEPTEKAHRLADVIRDVLAEAVEAGGSTLRDHAQVDGSLGYFQHSFRVYDREGEPCVTPGCTGTVDAPRAVRPLHLLLPGLPEALPRLKTKGWLVPISSCRALPASPTGVSSSDEETPAWLLRRFSSRRAARWG